MNDDEWERWLVTVASVGKPRETELLGDTQLFREAMMSGGLAPSGPAANALNLIFRMPIILPTLFPLSPARARSLCLVLDAENVFEHLSGDDAGMVAGIISASCSLHSDPSKMLREHARRVVSGEREEDCDDRDAAVRALNLAASAIEAWNWK
jgi:hypothetical protein